jgi:hypothetical protein
MSRPPYIVSLAALVTWSCVQTAPAGDLDEYFDPAGDYDVREPLSFTQEPYGLTGIGAFKNSVFPASAVQFAPGDAYMSGTRCEGRENNRLPAEVTGVVTILPRFYMKISGCDRAEEKYYGNYFLEDDSGGVFVVGDSKVANFDAGDTVTLRVRAVRTNFDFDMVYGHDVVSVDRTSRPVRYAWSEAAFTPEDVGRVKRIRGVVASEPDTFGQLTVTGEDGTDWFVGLDAELNRRRVWPTVGATLCATGPVQYSFSEYSLVVMRVGQLAEVEPGEDCPDVTP